MASTVTYDINNSSDATSGSNQQFLDIETDLSFSTVTIPDREGKRFENTSDTSFFRTISLTKDISLNYLDPSWNFHISLDTSRNRFQGQVVELGGIVPYVRNARVFIYDISYNARTDTNADGTPFVPKFYDPSGGSSGNFQGVSFSYAFLGDISNVAQGGATFQGFTYSPMVGDTTEVLPNQGGGSQDSSGNTGGGGGGSGGGGTVDPSGGTDSSGNNTADNSQNIFVIDTSLNLWFFDPPKAATDGDIKVDLTQANPRLDCSWNNPEQYRVAFDFLGLLAPAADLASLLPNNAPSRDDFNFLPYFQGLRLEYLLYDRLTKVPIGNGTWTQVPQTNLVEMNPTRVNSSYWRGKEFLPRFISRVYVYNSTYAGGSNAGPPWEGINKNPSAADVSNGIIFYNDSSISQNLRNSYVFSLPSIFGPNNGNTAGAEVKFRLSMWNRARASINDPSYVEHNTTLGQDVSWNWIYLPDISGGQSLGSYGAATAPLVLINPTGADLKYFEFITRGRNDNSGNDISANSTDAIVEDGLFTRFGRLTIANDGLPKVRYRYDISGHVLSTSKQIDGNIIDIDLSRNIPNTDVSANWLPTSQISDANSWNNLHNRTAGEVYPEHRYQFKSYSMRYSLDPNIGTDASLNDLSWNNYQAHIWETPRPQRSDVTTNSTYLNEMSALTDTTPWIEDTSTGWTQSQYTRNAIQAFSSSKIEKANLLFLNDGNDSALTATPTVIKSETTSYNEYMRANHSNFIGIDASNNNIMRIRSSILENGTTTSWNTDLDLSGSQSGFQGTNPSSGGYNLDAIATNPSNLHLEWSTDALRDARDKTGTDDLREGGYYCGTRLTSIKVKNVSLQYYRDISHNTNQRGYKVAIWQELLSQTGPTQFISYPSVNGGWTKAFATATRPVDDIDISLNSTFILNDGFDGTGSYQQGGRTNNFKFGSDNLGEDPSKNFFGLPILSKTSTNIINYSIGFDNLDATWWPASGNLIADLKLYIKGTGVASAPGPTGFINWKSQSETEGWNTASSSGFPKLPVAANRSDVYSGTFDFNGETSTSFSGYKYSRVLMDTGYSPSTNTPLFHIEASYDNNLLRQNRGINSSALENNARRSLDAVFTADNKNRFEGKGVGPNGSFTLFWDHTFDLSTSKNFQNVGEIGQNAPYNAYPFVEFNTGGAIKYNSTFDHTTIMSGTGGGKQLMWSGEGFGSGKTGKGFKHGNWAKADENPYINYTNKYWFGNHTSTLTVNYSIFDNSGEEIDRSTNGDGGYYDINDITPWWTGAGALNSSFSFFNGHYKVLVIKDTLPNYSGTSSFPQRCVELRLWIDDVEKAIPVATPTDAQNGTAPLVWFLEDEGTTNVSNPGACQFPVPPSSTYPGYSNVRTGWKATHKKEDTASFGSQMPANNMGCLHNAVFTATSDKVFDLTGTNGQAYDIYFRILVPNKNDSNNRISRFKITYKRRNGGNLESSNVSVTSVNWEL